MQMKSFCPSNCSPCDAVQPSSSIRCPTIVFWVWCGHRNEPTSEYWQQAAALLSIAPGLLSQVPLVTTGLQPFLFRAANERCYWGVAKYGRSNSSLISQLQANEKIPWLLQASYVTVCTQKEGQTQGTKELKRWLEEKFNMANLLDRLLGAYSVGQNSRSSIFTEIREECVKKVNCESFEKIRPKLQLCDFSRMQFPASHRERARQLLPVR